ncbi:MAG: UDP-N-acetylglucosamine 4,6-dehydratase [Bacteroidales bacterium]|nr:UDP-N-acetylglucosamine 4,6-dehydratase [Bacteroidales bacterium]MDD4431564.1 UDP-N-acetylglucosamine 4,6-dehydratase [Bacteroidales bacterium]
MDILQLIGRTQALFDEDLAGQEQTLSDMVAASRFLVIGGAGSIGQAVSKEIFRRNPRKLHIVDLSENNLAELVRDIRSSFGYIGGDFQTFALDCGSSLYDAFWQADGHYDYVLNLSALKHVRSEKDPYTLMRMIDVNIFNTVKTLKQAGEKAAKKYFCVSTDKAANPANMMGATKRIMEMFLMQYSRDICLSTARFANVAFSDGSLLQSFEQRMQKRQPIVAPNDVKRYFVTARESGELCLLSTLLGENRDIFFPRLSEDLHLQKFSDIAVRYIQSRGYEPCLCNSEQEARELMHSLPDKGSWPCLFAASDTTGEKEYEEFYTGNEQLDMERFRSLGIVKNPPDFDPQKTALFVRVVQGMKAAGSWTKDEIVALFYKMIPDFAYIEKGKYLDSKM